MAVRSFYDKYRVIFSGRYLLITLNSTLLFLASFFLVHFLTHLVTGLSALYCEISTTLNYTMVDFHIRYWEWTPEMVIIVFTVPALFSIGIALLCSAAFMKRQSAREFFKRIRYFTKKQRYRHKKEQRKREIERQVQRLSQAAPAEQDPQRRSGRRRLPWSLRLFLLWTMYHSLTYFFSGMLYAFLFHRRFGYVIWYAFNNFFFDVLFSVIALLSMLAIGYYYAVQIFHSGRMYLGTLNERNRMPFAVSQTLLPFIAGTIITVLLQLPKFDPSLVLLNFSFLFFLLPLSARSARQPSLHFAREDPPAKVFWGWLLFAALVVTGILIAVKIGIPLHKA